MSNNFYENIVKLSIYFFCRIETTEMMAKSEVASTRLRYEQQGKNLNAELITLQVSSTVILYIIIYILSIYNYF